MATRPFISRDDWLPIGTCSWQLQPDEVHVWRINVAAVQDDGERVISDEERQRAQRFKRDEDRQRFIVRRFATRDLLSRYSQISPQDICFRAAEFGKPLAFDRHDQPLLSFSSSSRGPMILIAFGETELGVDVENTLRAIEYKQLAVEYFHADEAADIQACHGLEERNAFFHCWTRKEAYVKAIGQGLRLPLNAFRVSVSATHAELIWRDPSILDEKEWIMRSIEPHDGYVGAWFTARQLNMFGVCPTRESLRFAIRLMFNVSFELPMGSTQVRTRQSPRNDLRLCT